MNIIDKFKEYLNNHTIFFEDSIEDILKSNFPKNAHTFEFLITQTSATIFIKYNVNDATSLILEEGDLYKIVLPADLHSEMCENENMGDMTLEDILIESWICSIWPRFKEKCKLIPVACTPGILVGCNLNSAKWHDWGFFYT